MCDIAGFLDGRQFPPPTEEATAIIRRMADAVAHRGPDDSGAWFDGNLGVALTHRRLAVMDPSPAGHQPMQSMSGRYVIVFNGEIYNHLELRRQLGTRCPNTCSWKGRSDTETLLAAIDCWELEKALQAAIGMFAFALWDRADRTLYLVRDRLGEKPLYYGWQNGVFLFGSEIKALAAHPAFGGDIDRDALPLLLRNGYVPSPWSIYKGVRKLPAGTYVKIAVGVPQERSGEMPEPQQYWSLRTVIKAGRTQRFEGTPQEAVDALHDVLLRAVRQQMSSDVPLGAFLYDEPFADPSQIPTYLVASIARKSLTVALSGDGGDESFGGYAHYIRTARLWCLLSLIPAPLRRLGTSVIGSVCSLGPDRLSGRRWLLVRTKARKLRRLIDCRTPEEIYACQRSRWPSSSPALLGGSEPTNVVSESASWPAEIESVSRFMAIDTLSSLPDDMLVKVDRAAMGVGLETRMPLLDHRVLELAWRLPLSVKLRNGRQKWILRQVLSKYVPEPLFERPKTGFLPPLTSWLRGPLRDWAEALLDERRLQAEGFFDPQFVRQEWRGLLGTSVHYNIRIWIVLMFQAWLDHSRKVGWTASERSRGAISHGGD